MNMGDRGSVRQRQGAGVEQVGRAGVRGREGESGQGESCERTHHARGQRGAGPEMSRCVGEVQARCMREGAGVCGRGATAFRVVQRARSGAGFVRRAAGRWAGAKG